MAEAASDAKMLRTSAYRAVDDLRERLPELMDGVGLDVRSILCRIREKMDAHETKFFQYEGKVTQTVDVEAHGVQLKAIELAASLRPELRPDASVSVGTVNVLFTGAAMPDWIGQHDAPSCAPNGNSADLVHNDASAITPPPLSTVEGTGREPGGIGHTNSGNVDGAKCDSAATVVPVETVPVATVPAKSKLAQRIVKKRQPRLPVYRP